MINTLIFGSEDIVSDYKDIRTQAVVASIDYKIHNGIPTVYSNSGKKN